MAEVLFEGPLLGCGDVFEEAGGVGFENRDGASVAEEDAIGGGGGDASSADDDADEVEGIGCAHRHERRCFTGVPGAT